MRKRWLVLLVALACVASLSACKGKSVDEVTSSETLAEYVGEESLGTEVESESGTNIEDYTEASTEADVDGLVKIADIKDEAMEKSVRQAQSGLMQLALSAGMSNLPTNIASQRDTLFESLGITQEDLAKLVTQSDLETYLLDKGLTSEQVFSYSIYTYLLNAYAIGDVSTEASLANFLTKTKEMLQLNGLDFDTLVNTRSAAELQTYVEGQGSSLKALNTKLYVSSIFPGVDIDADAFANADTPEAFLQAFVDSGYTPTDLATKAAEPDKAGELLETLKKIEEEAKKKEEDKATNSGGTGTGGSGNNSGSGSGNSKDNVKESLANKEQETLPNDGGSNSVVVSMGGNYTGSINTDKENNNNNNYDNGNCTITAGTEKFKAKIIVKKLYRGDEAISEIAQSNGNVPGQIDVDKIPEDYEWAVVKFSVDIKNSTKGSIRPIVRVKNMSGGNIETASTRAVYIESSSVTDEGNSRTYYVAFMLPENQNNYMLYFGDTDGTVYKFKSTALD